MAGCVLFYLSSSRFARVRRDFVIGRSRRCHHLTVKRKAKAHLDYFSKWQSKIRFEPSKLVTVPTTVA